MRKDVIRLHQNDEIIKLLYTSNFPGLIGYLEEHSEFDVNAEYEEPDKNFTGNIFILTTAFSSIEMIEELLNYSDELGLIVNKKNRIDIDALWASLANFREVEVIELLLKTEKFDVNQEGPAGASSLFDMALGYDEEDALTLFKLLLKYGYKATTKEFSEYTELARKLSR